MVLLEFFEIAANSRRCRMGFSRERWGIFRGSKKT